jgi:hypothetical protein
VKNPVKSMVDQTTFGKIDNNGKECSVESLSIEECSVEDEV